MSRVLFIRHAETEMAGRFCGHSNPELNAQGRLQLAALTGLLSAEPIDTVYSSDLRRASSTAQAIAAAREVPQVLLRPALREIDFGQWEGLSWEQIEQMDPEYAREWVARYPHVPAPSEVTLNDCASRSHLSVALIPNVISVRNSSGGPPSRKRCATSTPMNAGNDPALKL